MFTPMYDIPDHYPIPVNALGQGPADPDEAVETRCWCSDRDCMLFYPRPTLRNP